MEPKFHCRLDKGPPLGPFLNSDRITMHNLDLAGVREVNGMKVTFNQQAIIHFSVEDHRLGTGVFLHERIISTVR